MLVHSSAVTSRLSTAGAFYEVVPPVIYLYFRLFCCSCSRTCKFPRCTAGSERKVGKEDRKAGIFPLHPLRHEYESTERVWKQHMEDVRTGALSAFKLTNEIRPLTTSQLEPGDQQLVRRLFTRFISFPGHRQQKYPTLPLHSVLRRQAALPRRRQGRTSSTATISEWKNELVQPHAGRLGRQFFPVNPQPCSWSTSAVETVV